MDELKKQYEQHQLESEENHRQELEKLKNGNEKLMKEQREGFEKSAN